MTEQQRHLKALEESVSELIQIYEAKYPGLMVSVGTERTEQLLRPGFGVLHGHRVIARAEVMRIDSHTR